MLAAPASRVAAGRVICLDADRTVSVEGSGATDPESVLAPPALVNARPCPDGATKLVRNGRHTHRDLAALYLATAVLLARSVLGGAGIVMVHSTRVQGLVESPMEAAIVARAARDVGVSVGFAVALRDRNPLVYGPSKGVLAALPPDVWTEVSRRLVRAPFPVADQVAMVDTVAAAIESPISNVQYRPAGVRWCTPGLPSAVAQASGHNGRRVHMLPRDVQSTRLGR